MTISKWRAFYWILFSTLFVSGFAWSGWFYYLYLKTASQQDTKYNIIALMQSSHPKEGLRTVYLSELLEISIDNPTNVYRFSIEEGEKKLRGSPLIKEVKIKKIFPGTLYIEYAMREPVAYLGEYKNTVFDEQGYLFPLSPFYTPKKLPILYLGVGERKSIWGETIQDQPGFQLAMDVLKEGKKILGLNSTIAQIDVTHVFAESFGQREIVLLIEEGFDTIENKKYYLRLHAKSYKNNLFNYVTLREYLKKQGIPKNGVGIVDLRIPPLGYLKES